MSEAEVQRKIRDLTVDEFKALIRETILEIIDPDYGLELSPETERNLTESLGAKEKIPVEQVAERLGLEW
jgi:hypothetical protein